MLELTNFVEFEKVELRLEVMGVKTMKRRNT